MAQEIPGGGWRRVRGSPSVSVKMFAAAAAFPFPLPPSPPPYPSIFPSPLPQPTPPPPSHPPRLQARPVPSGRSALQGRAGPGPPAPGRSGRTGPRERGIETLCAEAPAFIKSTDTVEPNPQLRRDL